MVLDNTEHVLEAVAALVGEILRACPGVTVLCTSRSPVRVPGERIQAVAPLDRAAAVSLFVERVRAAGGDAPGPDERATVEELCERLDCLPLALQLAAARARILRLDDLVARLDRRFRLLGGGAGDAGQRDRSLAAAISWSYDLLPEADRECFDNLSVFADSFDVTAAHAVATPGDLDEFDTLDRLGVLVDRSMLMPLHGSGGSRYRLLESLRAFGRDRLDARPAATDVRTRWADHFTAVARAGARGVEGRDEATWVGRLHDEYANLRSVLTWAVDEGDVDRAITLVLSLFEYAFHRLRFEWGTWADEVLGLPNAHRHPLAGEVAAGVAFVRSLQGRPEAADTRLDLARVAAPESWLRWEAEALAAITTGDVGAAETAWWHAVDAAVLVDDPYREAIARMQTVLVGVFLGRDELLGLAEQAEAAAARSASCTAAAHAAYATGLGWMDRDPVVALSHLERAIDLASQVDGRLTIQSSEDTIERIQGRHGRLSNAEMLDVSIERLTAWRERPILQWGVLERLVLGLARRRAHAAVAALAGAEATASARLPSEREQRARYEEAVRRARDELGSEVFAEAATRGAGLQGADLVELARALVAEVLASEGSKPD